MSALLQGLLRQRIQANGPLTVAEYMAACLQHPRHGYYASRPALGGASAGAGGGDFITAPLVSQMFGELLGAWVATVWQRLGAQRLALVELGPGTGALMADLLRATRRVPGFVDALSLHLVEASRPLADHQARAVGGLTPHWHQDHVTLPSDRPLVILANEFFDALPIHQLIWSRGAWRELRVGWKPEGGMTLVTDPGVSPLGRLVALPGMAPREGEVAEVGPAAIGWMAAIAQRLATQGGAALVIDYGRSQAGALGTTLRAIRNHRAVSPFEAPGEADLSAAVDFPALMRVAREAGLRTVGLMEQGAFLAGCGLASRVARLAEGQPPAVAARLRSEAERLAGASEMGQVFKVMGVTPKTAPPLPVLEPEP